MKYVREVLNLPSMHNLQEPTGLSSLTPCLLHLTGHLTYATGAGEFHLTAARIDESDMIFRRKNILIGGMAGIPEFSRKVADPRKIKNIINILNMI